MTSRNSLIELVFFANGFETPYLQVLDEANFAGGFSDILGGC